MLADVYMLIGFWNQVLWFYLWDNMRFQMQHSLCWKLILSVRQIHQVEL
jgi:hypothetical protein